MCISVSTANAAKNVNLFTISSFTSDLEIGRDAQGRSTLITTETITAEFPFKDQNHGLERAIPTRYDGHTTNLQVRSVTDASGSPRTYETYKDDNNNLVVRMADMDRYVHGTQVYVLTYVQRDVTRYFEDTARDEFYWDINGTDWRVPIERLDATIRLSDEIKHRFTNDAACYQGEAGSTDRCEIETNIDGDTLTASATNLGLGKNMTVAIGFQPSTFEPYEMTLFEQVVKWWNIAQVFLLAVAIPVSVWAIYRWYRVTNRTVDQKPIVPEYIPPKNISVPVAADIARGNVQGSTMAAQLLDLAVRHYIRIYEASEKKWYKSAEYEVEIAKKLDKLLPMEREMLADMFGGGLPAVGARLNLKTLRNNRAYYLRTSDDDKKIRKLVRGKYSLRFEDVALAKWLRKVAFVVFVAALLSVSPVLGLAALVIVYFSFHAWTYTDKGMALRQYLDGLRLYIRAAEADRLRMLQSPSGVEKTKRLVGSKGNEQAALIKLYERTLPYAVLFGQEKEWTKQLGVYYEQSQTAPDWYVGRRGFNAAMLYTGIRGFSRASSYVNSASSSTGGSSGGGSSGGGGGGGGGGGV